MNIIQQLKKNFEVEEIETNTPSTLEEIELFEHKYNVKLSQVLKAYFLEFNGIEECMFGETGYSFYSLDRFRPVIEIFPEELNNPLYKNSFIFADVLLWSWGYAVTLDHYGNDGIVRLVATDYPKTIALNFQEFLEMYLDNKNELL